MKPVLLILSLLLVLVSCTGNTVPVNPSGRSLSSGTFGVGSTEFVWQDGSRDREVKVALWYPTFEASEPVKYLAFKGKAKKEATIIPGRHPLVIISHGTGSHRYAQFFMAEFLAARGVMVMSVEHPFDNAFDDRDTRTAANLWNRPVDISFALDSLLADSRLGSSVDQEKIGMIGHSIGGYTAFVIAGGIPNPERLAEYCSQHPEDSYMCYKFEGEKASPFRSKDLTTLRDDRIRAVFVMAPALGQAFGKSNMERVTVPVCLIASGRDEILPEPHNIGQYRKALPRQPEFHEFPGAGHFVYLPVCPLLVKALAMKACSDVGTPRQEIHPELNQLSLNFFTRHL